MKNSFIVFTALIVLTTFSTAASPPRHINPEELKVSIPDPQALSNVYKILATLISVDRYENSSQFIKLLLNVTGPADITYVLRRFHQELDEVNQLLNLSYTYLDQARQLVIAGNIKAASEVLSEAVKTLAKANLTRLDLEIAAREVERRLRAQPAPLLRAIAETIAEHFTRAVELNIIISKLNNTELTISVEPNTAWVGSNVKVSGKLSSSGLPLPNRRVQILVGGVVAGSVFTDDTGLFVTVVKLPYVYKQSITVGVLYMPEGEDVKVYRPSSNATEVKLLYEVPKLSVSVTPSRALPGDRVKVSVTVDKPGLQVEIRAFLQTWNLILNQTEVSLPVSVPEDIAEGVYKVTAKSKPKETIGPAAAEASLRVYKLNLTVTKFETPSLAFAMLPAYFTACVDNAVVPEYTARIQLLASTSEVNSSEACVTLMLTLPPLSPTGSTQAKLSITPLDPRYKPAEAQAQVTVVNLLLFTLIASLVPALALLKRNNKVEELNPSTLVHQLEEPVQLHPIELQSVDPVALEYLKAVRAVEKATGVRLNPSHTISEYLKLVESRLAEAAKPFALLSGVTEVKLYGGVEVDSKVARSLREKVEELLGGIR
ncbi:MAG: hypothetical protein RMI04_08615 [Thermofilaceae archaeon]|nr:hypothetical protein [Thermofilaceae archaeon]